MNDTSEDRLLSLREVSDILHVHPNTLRKWDKERILSPVRIGKRKDRHYRACDIEAIVQKEKKQVNAASVRQPHPIEATMAHTITEQAISRLTQIQDLTSLLSRALTEEDIARVVGEYSREKLQAESCTMILKTSDDFRSMPRNELSKRRLRGYLQSDTPLVRAFKGELIYMKSKEELAFAFPSVLAFDSYPWSSVSLYIPLRMGEKIIGVLVIAFREKKALVKDDLIFFLTIAEQIAQNVERARLFEVEHEARVRAEYMEHLFESIDKASYQFLFALSPSQTYSIVVEEAKKLFQADYGSLFLEKTGSLERIYTTASFLMKVIPRKEGLTYQAFHKNDPFVSSISQSQPQVQTLKMKSIISLPLIYNEKPLGVLTLLSKRKETVHEKEMYALKLFSLMASLAIVKAGGADRFDSVTLQE